MYDSEILASVILNESRKSYINILGNPNSANELPIGEKTIEILRTEISFSSTLCSTFTTYENLTDAILLQETYKQGNSIL